jgi:hypothetical protein
MHAPENIAGLELVDVIQLKGVSRFSGCISVHGEGFTGLLFFREGQVVHAETGHLVGEEAFYEIAQRPSTTFALQTVVTDSHTIHRSWQFLLMESQRLIDEARRKNGSGGFAAAPAERRVDLVERIRQIPGVVWATLKAKNNELQVPGADPMATQAAHLGALARVVGDRLGLGEVVGATAQGAERNLLLMATKVFHLLIVVQGGAQAAVTEAEIRKVLAARR